MSRSLRRATPWLGVVALQIGAACAGSEDVPEGPVRPGISGGSGGRSGAAGSAGLAGSSGVSGKGGSSGSSSSGGSSGVGASGGSAGSSLGGASGSSGGGSSGSAGSGGISGADSGAPGGAAGASGMELFSDNFESGTAKWISAPPDGWSIVADGSNVYKQGLADNLDRFSSAGSTLWTDQVIEARVKVLSFNGQSTSYLVGIYARFKDLENHYYLAIQSDFKIRLKSKIGGSNSSFSGAAPNMAALNTWYALKLEVIGSTIKAYVDGTMVLTATDTAIAAGGIALGCRNATAVFDDVRVTAP